MDTLAHLSINLFPVVMLLVIYLNNHKKGAHTRNKRQFNLLTVLTILLMCADVGRYGAEEQNYAGEEAVRWVFQILYMELIVLVAGVWLIYVCSRLYGKEHEQRIRRGRAIVGGISALYFLLLATTPWTHFVFYYTPEGQLVQAGGFSQQYIINRLLLLASILVSGYAWLHENSREQRRECLYILCFSAVTFFGMEVQHHWSNWCIGAPCVALSILSVYMNTQNRQITTDKLTGLNNRLDFDLHLKKRAEQSAEGEWGMLMMDVDDFKSINDNQGHIVGDEALWETADVLRRTFGRNKAFLARYGGDEFVVIADWNNEEEVRADIGRLECELETFNKRGEKPYRLSLSIGHAMWSEVQGDTGALVKKADARMYQKKMEKKEGHKGSRS